MPADSLVWSTAISAVGSTFAIRHSPIQLCGKTAASTSAACASGSGSSHASEQTMTW
nr:hypothetical protein [Parafrankia soli]